MNQENKKSKENDSNENIKVESILGLPLFSLIIFSVVSIILLYSYYRFFKIWALIIIAIFSLLFGFYFFIYGTLQILQARYPSHLLFKSSKDPVTPSSFFLSSFLALLFYFLTESYIFVATFSLLFLLGIGSRLRKFKFVIFFLLIISLISFFFAYRNKDLVLYIFSTLIVLYISLNIGELIGRNLEEKALFPLFSNSLFIISLSVAIFSYFIVKITIIYIIGIIGMIIFGIISMRLILESLLRDRFIHTREESNLALPLSVGIFSLLLFSIFLIYEKNIVIFIVASFSLFFGGLGSKLFLNRYFPDNISRIISASISITLLGITIILFYFLFLKITIIFLIGIFLIISSLSIIQRKIAEGKLVFK